MWGGPNAGSWPSRGCEVSLQLKRGGGCEKEQPSCHRVTGKGQGVRAASGEQNPVEPGWGHEASEKAGGKAGEAGQSGWRAPPSAVPACSPALH